MIFLLAALWMRL
ncbi:hypothetical protein LEMLEM_LOCUS27111 [Lemmus lemmus]